MNSETFLKRKLPVPVWFSKREYMANASAESLSGEARSMLNPSL
jgi:hypothetical protein